MLKIDQYRLSECYNMGATMVWHYNTLYQINYSAVQRYYYLTLVTRRAGATGVTARGRFMALNPSDANKYLAAA